MITVSIRLSMTPEHCAQAESILRPLLEPTRVVRGCLGFRVYRDLEDGSALLLAQEWASEGDLTRHVRGRDFQKVLAAIELASEPPDVEINDVACTRGMEFIEELSLAP
ncbi:MAG: antibiotic biosynthesis monooxygenase [Gammaproteobacteria bacterium]|nr:antibiotic biosynthesis monooxygenase [Gammaproteobacteria bacterium]